MIRRAFSQGCCTTPAAMTFWATVFILLYGVGLLIGFAWPELRQYTDTYLLAALGLACVANFGRNRTFHCGITGPVFMLGAIVMALIETRMWQAPGEIVWGIVLTVVAIALIFEWRIGGPDQSTSPPAC